MVDWSWWIWHQNTLTDFLFFLFIATLSSFAAVDHWYSNLNLHLISCNVLGIRAEQNDRNDITAVKLLALALSCSWPRWDFSPLWDHSQRRADILSKYLTYYCLDHWSVLLHKCHCHLQIPRSHLRIRENDCNLEKAVFYEIRFIYNRLLSVSF